MLIKLAWRNLWRRKWRTLITMGAIIFGVLFSVLIKGLKEGMYDRMLDNLIGGYSGHFQIQHPEYWDDRTIDWAMDWSEAMTSVLEADPNVKGVAPRLDGFVLAATDTITKAVAVLAGDPEKEKVLTKIHERLVEGEYLQADDKAVLIGKGLAEYLNLSVGDTLVLLGQGYQGTNAAGLYPIKGLVKFPSPEMNKSMIMMPLKEAQWLFYTGDKITSSTVVLNTMEATESEASRWQAELGEEFRVLTWNEMNPEIENMIESDRAEGDILMGILYVLITFVIFGTIVMMLAERKHELGVLVALGMKKAHLVRVLLMELVTIGLLGVFVGGLLSYPLLWYYHLNPIRFGKEMQKVYEEYGFEPVIQTSVDPGILMNQGLVVLFILALVSIYPIFKIRRMDAIKAMRS